MAQPQLLSDVTAEQIKEIAAYLDQGPLGELVDSDGNDSLSDEYWRKLIKRLAKLDRKYNLLDKSSIRSLEKEAWDLKSPSLKLLAILQNRGLQFEVFRSCLEHKEVQCLNALQVLKNGPQSPTIVTQPEDCDLDVGSELKLHCKVHCTYPLQYQWFKGQQPLANSNHSTYSVHQVELSHTGQYTCRVRNPCIVDPKRAFVFSRSVQVTINPPPQAPIQETSHPHGPPIGLQPSEPPSAGLLRITTQPPNSLDTLYGSVATLSCRARGWLPDQVITYQWYKDGTTVPSDNTGDLRISTVTCEDQGQYHCVASCGSSRAESDPVNLHVELDQADGIEITEHPADLHARINETITLKCQAHNKSGKELVFQWFKDNKKAAIGPECKIHLKYKHHTMCKCYCRVSLKECDGKFVKSKYVRVTVNTLWFTVQPQDFDGYVGEPVILYCQAEGLLPGTKISYLWLKSSTPGATNPQTVCEEDTLVIQSLKDSHYGYYTCQASDTTQFISSRPVFVSAKLRDGHEEKKAPVIRFTKQPRSRAVEEGKPFSLVCKAIASSGCVSFQWYKNGHMLPEEQKERLDGVATLNSFGSYYCIVKTTNAYGCALSETARVSMSLEQPVQTSTGRVLAQIAERCYRTKEEGHYAQEKVALLIGNGHYKEMKELKAVESDIRNLHKTLTDLRFKVISLLDLQYDEMMKALDQFYKYLQSGVYAVFYFSGHGFNVNNITYLMPTDVKKEPLNCNECISSKTIEYHIQEKCAIGVALLDCCKVSDGRIVSSSSSDAAAFGYATYLEISACHEGFIAFADATGSVFNKALIPSLKKKVAVNNLDQEILTEMRKINQNCMQSPFRKGTILHTEMTLHDPIMLSNEGGAEEIMDFLSQQYSKANSVPDPMNIEVEPCAVQLGLSFSAEFSNVLKVTIQPLAGNISVISVNVENSQNVNASSDKVSDGSFSFKIESIQRAVWPLKLCMKVTVSIDGREQCISHMHELKDKFMFASLI